MSLKISFQANEKVSLNCENVISPWNILKHIVETPYLKSYYIENYEGGNTLVPRELWAEENITYKEVKNNAFLFPYNSINFVFEDSIHNIDVYVVEQDNKGFKSNNELFFSIKDSENLFLKIKKEKLPDFASLYLFSIIKIGYDQEMFEALKELLKKLDFSKIKEMEYIPGSFLLNFKGFSFILKLTKANNEVENYKITFIKGKFKKELLKENSTLNIGFLKKKIFSKNKWVPVIYYTAILCGLFLLFFFKKKFFILILFLYLIFQVGYLLVRKNIHKIFKLSR